MITARMPQIRILKNSQMKGRKSRKNIQKIQKQKKLRIVTVKLLQNLK